MAAKPFFSQTNMYEKIGKSLRRFLTEDEGPTAVEYAVMLALIVGVVIGSVGQLATATKNNFDASGTAINGAMSP